MNYQRHTKLIPSSPEKNPMNSSTRQDGANMHVHKYLILHAQLYVYIYTWLYAYLYLHENNYRPTIKNNMSSNSIIHTKVGARSNKNLGSAQGTIGVHPRGGPWASEERKGFGKQNVHAVAILVPPIKLTQPGRCQNKKRHSSIKNWMGPNPNGPLSKLLELLDKQV